MDSNTISTGATPTPSRVSPATPVYRSSGQHHYLQSSSRRRRESSRRTRGPTPRRALIRQAR